MKQLALCEVATLIDSSKWYGWDTWLFQDDFTLCTWHRDLRVFQLSNGDIVIFNKEYEILWDNEIEYYDTIIHSEKGTIYVPKDKQAQEEIKFLKELKYV